MLVFQYHLTTPPRITPLRLKPIFSPLCIFFMALVLSFSPVLTYADDTAIYWSITKQEKAVGYLLGTIHSEDPRVLDFPLDFLDQLGSNQVFAMELVPDLPTLQKLTNYMRYQDGTSLQSQVGQGRFKEILKLLSRYQVPPDWIENMKVWAVVMTLSVPPPETGFFLDFSLSLRAAGSGLKVVGLETLDQQLSFLEEMPMPQQLELLDQAMTDYQRVQEVHDQMVDAYLADDLQALRKESELQLGQLELQLKEYFIERGINVRNRRMLASLLPLLEESAVFVAVGALHLPGEQGLIALLREAGYQLQPQPLPFAQLPVEQ